VASDLAQFAATEDTLPIGMLLFSGGSPVGAGALKAESISTHRHLRPWATAGYIVPELRRRGVGAVLLRALVEHANGLGFQHAYCATSSAASLLTRLSCQVIEVTQHDGKSLTVFRSAA
jgi:GNAT superfamily N-acetyltransferase